MTAEGTGAGRSGSRWARLSTGLKMWIILSLGLLPLGVIAVLASIDNAAANRDSARREAETLLAQHSQRFALALSRNAFTIRAGRDALIATRGAEGICERTLARLGRYPNVAGRFAIFADDGRPRCLSEGFALPPVPAARGEGSRATIAADGATIDVFLYEPGGRVEGVNRYDREALRAAVDAPALAGDFAVELVQGDRVMALRTMRGAGPTVAAEFPFANGQYAMRVRVPEAPMTLAAVLAVLTPILMWLWASLVGWIIVQRLLLRPLARLRDAMAAYRPGDGAVDPPAARSPAQEIVALGASFGDVTRTVASHEAELEAAVARQTRLVREVHHRVKNNLQVVASLLNLHSRGAANAEVAAAYASIQRRVDALAVVHRNHYAELEDNRGVALKPLITELTANLRATAPAQAAAMQIRLDVGPFYVSQDVAVSVAFLITEITEFAMLCGAGLVSIALDDDVPGKARLSVQMDMPDEAPACDPALETRFERIVTGLARQLRSVLEREPEGRSYSLTLAVVGKG